MGIEILQKAEAAKQAKKNILTYKRHQKKLLSIGEEASEEPWKREFGKDIQFRGDLVDKDHKESRKDIRISPELTVIWEVIKREKDQEKCRTMVRELLGRPESQGGCKVISVEKLRASLAALAEEREDDSLQNMWFATTSEGIDIRPGLLDKESPTAMSLGDNCVHALMAGRTGSGKSVALHGIITGMMFQYAPWELNINLADFKIVEMSKYGNTTKAPHVEKIAATDGMEYVLSMMYDMYEKMDIRQKVFAALGVQKLSQYRKEFEVALPREILIVDEFQQMYELATPKQAEIINQLIKMITKLGRATGYHLFFTSQSMTGTVRADVLANFKLRLCLPASEEVSSMVLGNRAAAELTGSKSRGYVIANAEGGMTDFNKEFWVPLIKEGEASAKKDEDRGDLENILRINASLAEMVGFDKGMDFYREEALRPLWGDLDSLEKDFAAFYANTRNALKEDDETEDFLLLGDSCVYARLTGKNSSLEYTPIKFGDRKHILCIGDSIYQRSYMMELLAVQYRVRENNRNYIVHGDMAVRGLLKMPGASFTDIPARELNHELLNHYEAREFLQSFVQMPKEEQTKENMARMVRQKWEKKISSPYEETLRQTKKRASKEEQLKKAEDMVKSAVETQLAQKTENQWAMYQKGLDKAGQFRFKRLKTITFWVNGFHMLSDLMEQWNGKYEGVLMADVLKRCTNMGIRLIAVGAKAADFSPSVIKNFGYYLIQSSDEANYNKLGMTKPKEYKDTVMRFCAVNEPLNRQKPSLYILPQDEKMVKVFETEGSEPMGREREFFAGIG